jgi:hypothetical protein
VSIEEEKRRLLITGGAIFGWSSAVTLTLLRGFGVVPPAWSSVTLLAWAVGISFTFMRATNRNRDIMLQVFRAGMEAAIAVQIEKAIEAGRVAERTGNNDEDLQGLQAAGAKSARARVDRHDE